MMSPEVGHKKKIVIGNLKFSRKLDLRIIINFWIFVCPVYDIVLTY